MSTTTERMLRGLESSVNGLPSPLYVVDEETLRHNIGSMKDAFAPLFRKFIMGYSYKTNYTPAILRVIHQAGGFAEVVSPMELALAKQMVEDRKIIYNGVIQDPEGKYELALAGGIVNVENMTELRQIAAIAKQHYTSIDIGIRVNLDLEGAGRSRFGIEVTDDTLEEIRQMRYINLVGIHCHVTKARSIELWKRRAREMGRIGKKIGVRYIDFGGNMYGPMSEEVAKRYGAVPSFSDYASASHAKLSAVYGDEELPCIIIEPGTPLVSNVQAYVARVVDIKETRGKTICLLNGKSRDMASFVDARDRFPFKVIHTGEGKGEVVNATIYGCSCVEEDIFITDYSGPLAVGDHILFETVGSYSNVLAPRFIQAVPAMAVFKEENFDMVKSQDSMNTIFGEYK